MKLFLRTPCTRHLLNLLLSAGLLLALPALAAPVVLATSPLATSSSSVVSPNLMFMLDDSGSMDWDYMPDTAKNFSGKYGFNSSQCNGTYYNPAITYTPPVTSAGLSYPNSSFTAAWDDGYNTGAGTTDLSTSFTGGSGTGASGINLTAQQAFYYTYSGTQTTSTLQNFYNTSSTFYQECNSAIGSTPGVGVFTKHLVSATSGPGATDERTNFANWYSYYSTRMLMMKTGVGLAFKTMNNKFRVGFMTMNNNVSPGIVDIATYDTAQKSSWYSALYAANPGQSTPLRQALSQVGQLYANKFAPTTTYTATITVNGSSSTTVSSIQVGPVGGPYDELMNATTSGSSRSRTVASRVAGEINTKALYDATSSGSVITIFGPASALGRTPVITKSGSMTFTTTAFTATTVTSRLNGIVPNDPIQYSCQKNFVILSTDGYWNGNAGYKLDNTAIGNQDSLAPRAMYDGASVNETTSRVQESKTQVAKSTSQIQQRTTQIQSSTSTLLSSTSNYQSSTWPLLSSTSNLLSLAWQLQYQTAPLQKAVSGDGGNSWSSWSNTASCTWATTASGYATITVTGGSSTVVSSITVGGVTITSGASTGSSTNSTEANNLVSKITQNGWSASRSSNVITIIGPVTAVGALVVVNVSSGSDTFTIAYTGRTKCQYDTANWTPWTNGACTILNKTASSNGTTWTGDRKDCQYVAGAASTVTSCSNIAKTTSTSDGTIWVTNAKTCGYSAPSADAPAASCTYQNQSTSSPYVGPAVTCSYGSTQTVATVTSCTPGTKTSSTADGTVWNPNATTCGYTAYSTPTPVATCTAQAQSTSPPYASPATNCTYSTYSAWANTSSCSTQAPSGGSPYTVATATQCQTTDTGFVGASSCTPSGPTGGQTVTCNTINTGGPTNYVVSCTPVTASAGNSWTTTTCLSNTIQPPTLVASCTAGNSGTPDFIETTCAPTSTTVNNVSSCTAQTASSSNGYTTKVCTAGSGGTSDTLADTAMYYYQTDLRDSSLGNCTGVLGLDVCENNVTVSGIDNNDKQHLTTFTLGLGARGKMAFSSTYLTDTSGDFYSVKQGSTATAGPPVVCSWQASGACNWPVPSSGAVENIDDLWHAAINGRGTYFNATDPATLSAGLAQALKNIDQVTGAAAAAATSTLNPVAGNNYAYVASYTTVKWTGNLEQRSIDINNGTVSQTASWCIENIAPPTCIAPNNIVADTSGSSVINYCVGTATDINADGNVDAADCVAPSVFYDDGTTKTCRDQIANTCVGTLPTRVAANSDTRKIYTANSAGTALVNFDAAYATANPANFSAAHISGLSQWTSLTTGTGGQQEAAVGTNLINFLRGQNGYEENRTSNAAAKWIYRYRDAVLGDALESQPTFVAAPTFGYSDKGYSSFVTTHTNRGGTVFMGANDGMLHAFQTGTEGSVPGGTERWAYVPSMVIPNMWKLADKNYNSMHVNFVNGPPVISDICTANCTDNATAVWRTILVGGLNAGGRGFFALDITDPTDTANYPKLLWEFTPAQSANLGYSFARPIITKKLDGTWVVLVTSGYDNGTLSADNVSNNSPAGDGLGYLYVLDAKTGSILSSLSTGVGSAATPSGLAKISAYNDIPGNNQAGYVYGGDLLGNLWRFDINATASASNPFKLATLFSDTAGTQPQPITITPSLGKIKGKRVIFVGTGKYLETSDLSNTQRQTVYAIKDDASATLVNPRTTLVQQTITNSGSTRTGTNNAVDFTTGRGWYVDLPDTGERSNVDFKLVQGTILVPSIVPSNTICSPGGYGWLNYFDFESGAPVDTTGVVAQKYSSPIVGMNVIYINGEPVVEIVTSNNPTPEKPANAVPFRASSGGFMNTREIWRELIQ